MWVIHSCHPHTDHKIKAATNCLNLLFDGDSIRHNYQETLTQRHEAAKDWRETIGTPLKSLFLDQQET